MPRTVSRAAEPPRHAIRDEEEEYESAEGKRRNIQSRRGDRKEEGTVVGDRLWGRREEERQIYFALTGISSNSNI